MSILNVKDLKKSYLNPDTKEKFNAVDGISFEIETTQIYGILGPNGAGKTTTLEMVEGLTDIDGGFACVNGLDVAENPYKVKEIIGVQLQSNEYFDSLSLKELLILFGKLYKNNVNVNVQSIIKKDNQTVVVLKLSDFDLTKLSLVEEFLKSKKIKNKEIQFFSSSE